MTLAADRPLRHVSDTALWVAAYRALESERPDALFVDPWARRLAGERGFAVMARMHRARGSGWPFVARTVMFDEHVLAAIEAGFDLVVNLAAGLDTRPYRMELPADLHWIEVDLPGMVEEKSAAMAGEVPRCRLDRIAADLADPQARAEVLDAIAARGRRALVLTEGLVIYLAEPDVADLARDLATHPTYRWWVLDLTSPGMLRRLGRSWGREVAKADAPFRFAPQAGPAFFAELGWPPQKSEMHFHAAARIGRLPWFLQPFRWLPAPRRWNPDRLWAGVLRLERPE